MENKQVGWIIIGISVVILFVIFLFNQALKELHGFACDMGNSCPAYGTIALQTWISVSIAIIVLIIGLSIMFTKPRERIVIRKIKEKRKKLDLNGLDKDEKKVIKFLQDEGKAVFQRDLMEKLEIGKVKTTRLLDKLEAKQFIERKRRGMNNIVVLRD
ncbi:MAG: helix-turn-helix transcriptional regulator [Candidatus Nanoarchaeia archaeon]